MTGSGELRYRRDAFEGELQAKGETFEARSKRQGPPIRGLLMRATPLLVVAAACHAGVRGGSRSGRMGIHRHVDLAPLSRSANDKLQTLHHEGRRREPRPLDGAADPAGRLQVTPGAKSADTYTWVMECAKPSMRGTGSARLSRASMEGETHMTGEVHGQKFELRTKRQRQAPRSLQGVIRI